MAPLRAVTPKEIKVSALKYFMSRYNLGRQAKHKQQPDNDDLTAETCSW